jgi:hypothetical protein
VTQSAIQHTGHISPSLRNPQLQGGFRSLVSSFSAWSRQEPEAAPLILAMQREMVNEVVVDEHREVGVGGTVEADVKAVPQHAAWQQHTMSDTQRGSAISGLVE